MLRLILEITYKLITNLKLLKAVLFKITQLGRFFGKVFGSLLITGLPLVK